jgi:hypothetical protein
MSRKTHCTWCDAILGMIALLGILLFLTPGGWIVLVIILVIASR